MFLRSTTTLAALLLGALPLSAQVSFGTYVSVGDSLAAGYQSSSLVETHQARSVPALLARQGGAQSFEQPLVAEPGLPPELTLVQLVPAPVLAPKAATGGAPRNPGLARAYNNLAVPGASSVDALTRTTDAGGFHDLILRGRGTQVAQAASLTPTLVTLWIGNGDVLGAALRGRAVDGVTLTPAPAFRAAYQQIVAALRTGNTRVVAANLPDVTAIPFVTTIKPYVTHPTTGAPVLSNGQPVPLLGPTGPLPQNAFVTLAASSLLATGVGIPTALGGRGTPLPDEVVLDPAEIAIIRERVAANNQAIREICQAAGVPLVDLHALLDDIAREGRHVGGVTLTTSFLSGGLFSYDGVHLTDLGYAVVANEWIAVLNANGASLAPVDLGPYLGVTAARAASLRTSGTAAFEFTPEAWGGLLAAFPELDR